MPLTYVYSDEGSYDPLARIDGSENPEIYGFHNQPNGTPERLTDVEGQLRWEGQNSAWGKLLRESSLQAQDLRKTCVCKANTSTAKPACTIICSLLRPGLRAVYPAGPDRVVGGIKPLPVCAESAELG